MVLAFYHQQQQSHLVVLLGGGIVLPKCVYSVNKTTHEAVLLKKQLNFADFAL